MDRILSDLAHAFRRLLRAPGYASIALLTLSLGIGANTAIFSLVKAVVLKPLPYMEPDGLVMVWGTNLDRNETTWLSGPEMHDYAAASTTFRQFAAWSSGTGNLTGGMEPERVIVGSVTPNLFATLGVRPMAGRAFAPTDSAANIANDVVLGYGLWQRRFGGRTDVVGQTVQVNGTTRTIIGVMPPSFRLPRDFGSERRTEIWMPLDIT